MSKAKELVTMLGIEFPPWFATQRSPIKFDVLERQLRALLPVLLALAARESRDTAKTAESAVRIVKRCVKDGVTPSTSETDIEVTHD